MFVFFSPFIPCFHQKNTFSFSGFLGAFIVGFHATLIGTRFAMTVILFFITSSLLTKFKSKRKQELEEDFKVGSQRTLIQVIANGLPGTLMLIGFSYVCLDDQYLGKNFTVFFFLFVF